MSKIYFEVDEKQLKNREKIHKNKYIENLINIFLNDSSCINLIDDINSLFYIVNEESLNDFVQLHQTFYEGDELHNFNKISSCFKSLVNSNLSYTNIRGGFLEQLVYVFNCKKYPDDKVYKEIKVKADSFESNLTFDVGIRFNNNLNVYECKFSKKFIERKHIDNLASMRKFKTITSCLIVFENKVEIDHTLKKLRNNTKKEEYNKILKSFQIITLDDFKNGYFHDYN